MFKYMFDVYPVKSPIIEAGSIKRNEFLNSCYCIAVCFNKPMQTKNMLRSIKATYSNYNFYVYDRITGELYYYDNKSLA
ncbi:MAG: hypothetical protein LIR50_22130 [Bacillota bacterium]|nr:hypothetical protein [Bacillota bacterium]